MVTLTELNLEKLLKVLTFYRLKIWFNDGQILAFDIKYLYLSFRFSRE